MKKRMAGSNNQSVVCERKRSGAALMAYGISVIWQQSAAAKMAAAAISSKAAAGSVSMAAYQQHQQRSNIKENGVSRQRSEQQHHQ